MDPSRLDLNLLKVFEAVVAERSVSRAAMRLSLSQPATSHALARLREACGDAIVVREGRAMLPTPRALQLLPEVQALLARARELFALSSAFEPATARRTFTVGASDLAGTLVLPRLLAAVRRHAPGLRLDVRHAGRNDGPDLVRAGAVDLAIGVFPGLHDDVQSRVVLEDRYVCAMAAGHPMSRSRITQEAYLRAAHVNVLVQPGTLGSIDESLARLGRAREIAAVVPHFQAALAVAAATDLIATLPSSFVRAAAVPGIAVRRPPVLLAPFVTKAIWARRRHGDPGLRWLIAQLDRTQG